MTQGAVPTHRKCRILWRITPRASVLILLVISFLLQTRTELGLGFLSLSYSF